MTRLDADTPRQLPTQRDKLMRIKLMADIEKFEKQLANLKSNGSYASFADIQALKELILARQDMLKRLQ
jgi:hypothetical protein